MAQATPHPSSGRNSQTPAQIAKAENAHWHRMAGDALNTLDLARDPKQPVSANAIAHAKAQLAEARKGLEKIGGKLNADLIKRIDSATPGVAGPKNTPTEGK